MEEALKSALGGLPHGPEFRFIDRLIQLDPGKTGAGEYDVRGTESFLSGHFPGSPMMPGVLLIEAAAQLAGVVAQSDPHHTPFTGLKLTGLRNVKILGTAVPGETVHLKCTIEGRMGHLVQASATATVRGARILEASITLSGDLSYLRLQTGNP